MLVLEDGARGFSPVHYLTKNTATHNAKLLKQRLSKRRPHRFTQHPHPLIKFFISEV